MNNRHWTRHECNLIRKHYPQKGAQYCCDIMDRSAESIKKKASRLRISTCISSSGRPQKAAIDQLDGLKVLAKCKLHGLHSHYTSRGKITGCVECVRLSNKHKPKTEKRQQYDRDKQRRYRLTPLGRYTSRLRVYLRGFLGRDKGCFRHLPYSPQQLRDHLEFIRCIQDDRCPKCGQSYEKVGFHIDHITPLSTATNKQEILDLFDLENLSLLCPTCNLKKGSKVGVQYA
ncbi:MAG: hypothetical protein DRJ03_00570 [Chloroflexi bacterium]|nr:MAG: hypothetical protein DRJ03_00570 [Chloroflexota bacterium]